jgi:septum formation inhibitor-activating ATPase MinD|tara:strand:- start:454 stop:558 length:105 start_codon:yes stop_codon:yes gene_type:complete
VLTGEDFINICNDAEERYYENIMVDTPLGIEGVA